MKFYEEKNRLLVADEGKELRRISDGWIAGAEVNLGYAHYLNGRKLDTPLWELPEHYEEVDARTEEVEPIDGEDHADA